MVSNRTRVSATIKSFTSQDNLSKNNRPLVRRPLRYPHPGFVTRLLLVSLLVYLASVPCVAQQTKLIELNHADLMKGLIINGEQAREFTGKVQFTQITEEGDRVYLWCDRALQYLSANRIELFGHVKIVRDTTTITSDEGKYYGNEKRAEVSSNVRLVRGNSVLTSLYGQYYVDEKRSHFSGNVHLVDSTSSIACDDLVYFESDTKSIATGNVRVVNLENSATILGDSLVHFEKGRYSIVPKNPRLIQIDTASSGVIDTLVVVSNIMESYQDSVERFVAIDSVKMARGELSASGGRTTFFVKKDLIVLQHHPIVWQALNQITGDSIDVGLQNKRLRSVLVWGHAVAISRSDSLYHNRYNQLTGRQLTMYFAHDQLDSVLVDKNATSLYYLYDQDKPDGANKSSGDHITINFIQGKIDRIKIVGGVLGQYFPEKMLLNHESEYNLDGFRWYTIRPRRNKMTIVDQRYD
jgi:lipopolysaccharide export system protein LptA